MSDPYLGEIKMFAGNFAPRGWAFCNGQPLAIGSNDALFALIGTTYGGDGQETFALPDLRGRVPIHAGTNGANTYEIGEMGGAETVVLTTPEMPAHSHTAHCNSSNGTSTDPSNSYWAAQPALLQYNPAGTADSAMKNGLVSVAGDSQPHDNMPPFVACNYIIAIEGIFPTRT